MRIETLVIDECTPLNKGAVEAARYYGVNIELWLRPSEVDAELEQLLEGSRRLKPEWDLVAKGDSSGVARRTRLTKYCKGIFVWASPQIPDSEIERKYLRFSPAYWWPYWRNPENIGACVAEMRGVRGKCCFLSAGAGTFEEGYIALKSFFL